MGHNVINVEPRFFSMVRRGQTATICFAPLGWDGLQQLSTAAHEQAERVQQQQQTVVVVPKVSWLEGPEKTW